MSERARDGWRDRGGGDSAVGCLHDQLTGIYITIKRYESVDNQYTSGKIDG